MKRKYLHCMILASVTFGSAAVSAGDSAPLYFNTTQPQNDLQGSFAARVQFAQSQIFPAHARPGDNQPHLISSRRSLVLVQPLKADTKTPLLMEVRDGNGTVLGTLVLSPPSGLPDTFYAASESAGSTPLNNTTRVISTFGNAKNYRNTSGKIISLYLINTALLKLVTSDGNWMPDFYLPQESGLDGKLVRIVANATYDTTIHFGQNQIVASRGQTLQFKYTGGQWVRDDQKIAYAPDTWSGELVAEWVKPGLNLQFKQGNLSGQLNDINVGAPGELLLHTIDIGMLTPPRNNFQMAKDNEIQREYFQTLPVSRMIVNNYAPVYLKEVMLPDGRLLTNFDPSTGSWHDGTMRQCIGKELISIGIDNANYGINSTAGTGEDNQPYVVAQLAAHSSRGKYVNGVQVHGGSGGGGIVTLEDSVGNEFSHEMGHNYGLGHYTGGFNGSVHRSADKINSTWGWDSDKKRFIPNYTPARNNKNACLDGQCQEPFSGHTFGHDAMAGGSPLSSANRFTLYTPNSAAIIQRFFENKAVFDRNSLTGFSKWNEKTGKMEPYEHTVDNSEQITASVNDLSAAKMAEHLAKVQIVNVRMWDGNWTSDINIPAASAANKGRYLSINSNATYASKLFINGQVLPVNKGYAKNFVSTGSTWQQTPTINNLKPRKPEQSGIAVTTLVGYYDPEGKLSSYIYPALYGAYGFTYPDDSAALADNNCQLQVVTNNGTLRFRLNNIRGDAGAMNKFHINVPTDSQPRQATLLCNNKTLDTKTLTPAPADLTYHVTGQPLPASENEGCIISVSSGKRYCLSAGKKSGYALPAWILGQEVYVESGAKAKVTLCDFSNLSYNRLAEFTGSVSTENLKHVKARNGEYLDFSHPKSMQVDSQ